MKQTGLRERHTSKEFGGLVSCCSSSNTRTCVNVRDEDRNLVGNNGRKCVCACVRVCVCGDNQNEKIFWLVFFFSRKEKKKEKEKKNKERKWTGVHDGP